MTDAQPPTEREKVAEEVCEIWANNIDSEDWLAIADYILARERQAFVNGYARAAKDAIEKWETVP